MPPLTSRLVPWPEHRSHDKQGIPVPGTKRPGQSRTLLVSESVEILKRVLYRSLSKWYTLPLQLFNYLLITWNRSLGTRWWEDPKRTDDLGPAFHWQFTSRTGLPMLGSPSCHIHQSIEIRSYLYLAHLRRCWPQTTIYWKCSPFAFPSGRYRRWGASDRWNLGAQLPRYVPVS